MNTQALVPLTHGTSPADVPVSWLAGQLSTGTLRVYQHDVTAYVTFCREQSLTPLDPSSLAVWRDEMVAHTRKSPKTINRMVSAVKRFVVEGSLPSRGLFTPELSVLFSGVPGVSETALKERLRPGTRTRIESVDMRGIAELPDRTTLKGKRDAAILATLASSGLRRSELVALHVEDIVQRDGGYFVVIRGGGKNKSLDREAWLSEEAGHLIEEWVGARKGIVESEFVFTSFFSRAATPTNEPLDQWGAWYIVKQYVQEYAKETGKLQLAKLTPHSFRRFMGTHLIERGEGVDTVAEALGHRNIKTTLDHYVLRKARPGITNHLY